MPHRPIRLLASIAALVICVPVFGFVTNISIGGFRLPCSVLCGDKGLINPNFIGDGLKSLVFGSSIDALDEKLKKTGDELIDKAELRLNSVLDDKLNQLNEMATYQRSELLDQLNKLSDTTIVALDETIQKGIEGADSKIDDQQGVLLGQSDHFITLVGQVLLLAGGAILVLVIVGLSLRKVASAGSRFNDTKYLKKMGIVIVVVIAVAALFFLAFKYWRESSPRSKYIEAYNANNFKLANLYAGALLFSDPGSRQYAIYKEKSKYIRDLIERPTILAKSNWINFSKGVDSASKSQYALTKTLDPDLETLRAMIEWRKSDVRLGEYYAAVHSYNALKNSENKVDGQNYAFSYIAKYYIGVYLLNPMSETELKDLGFDSVAANEVFGKEGVVFPSLENLIEISNSNPSAGWAYDYEKLYLSLIPKYVKLVYLHANTAKLPVNMRGENLKEEINLSIQIINEFDKFTETHIDAKDFKQVSMALTGLYAIYSRASAYKQTLSYIDHSYDLAEISLGNLLSLKPEKKKISNPADLVGQPCVGWPFHLSVLKNIPPRDPGYSGIHHKWLRNFTTSALQRTISLAAKNKLATDEARLFAFEYFTYLSEIPERTDVVSCHAPPIFEALTNPSDRPPPIGVIPAPGTVPIFAIPRTPIVAEQTRHLMFERGFTKPIQPIVPQIYPYLLSVNDLLMARHQAIYESAGLGLFVCGQDIDSFLDCEIGKPRISISQKLFDDFGYKNMLAFDVVRYTKLSKQVRSFPVID